jgi:alpha-tubulin suppressor-like RCC1 family protein
MAFQFQLIILFVVVLCFQLQAQVQNTVYGLGSTSNTMDVTVPNLLSSQNNFVQVSTLWYSTMALTSSGQVYVFGDNSFSQLGFGDYSQRFSPTVNPTLSNIKQISSGGSHMMFLTNNGQLFVSGTGSTGALGLGATTVATTPMVVPGYTNITQIAAGLQHSLFLTGSGQIYSFGLNSNGQLGLGNTTNMNMPVLITPFPSNPKKIACGLRFTGIVMQDGSLYTFGQNFVILEHIYCLVRTTWTQRP